MPDDVKPEPTPEELARDEFDQWLTDYEAEYQRALLGEYGFEGDEI
jgi:hypothetical protein